jgi:outer membrane receptor protein involved in Fe transport
VEFNFVGESTARGNENGEHEPDNVYYFGEGGTGGYGVWNFSAEWRPIPSLTAYLQVSNLTDHRYSTSSQLGATPFTTSGTYTARPFATPVIDGERPLLHAAFVAPGTPRTYLAGLRYRF